MLEANVEEKPTGQLQLSAGFSSIENFIFQASVQQRNFRGRGQTIGLSGSYSRYSKSVEASFTEPYLFDRNISLGVDIYRRDYNSFSFANSERNNTYSQATTGLQARLGIPLTEYLTAVASYTLNFDNISLGDEYFSDRLVPGTRTCEPLIAGRYLCEAIGKRTSSILGVSLIHDTLDNRSRPTRGSMVSVGGDFAGLGGSVKYGRLRLNAARYFPLPKRFIFSLSVEGGLIKSFDNSGSEVDGIDDVRLTDRFYLGEPQMRGFDIRGIGPRVLRKPLSADADGNFTIVEPDRDRWTDDAIGGKYYYQGRAELEIPLGSGAKELGIRPSIFMDVGAVWGVRTPKTQNITTPFLIQSRDASGNLQYQQIDAVDNSAGLCTPTASSIVTTATNPTPPDACVTGVNSAFGNTIPPFTEEFLGNTWKPRLAVGVGFNWNSPFGPFRIDFAKVLLKREGDDTKSFTFNVGTQF